MLRATAFVATGTKVDGDLWWSSLVGEPENKSSRNKGQEQSWDSAFGGGRLMLQTQPGRVDWIYAREQEEPLGGLTEAETSASPLDSLTDSIESFLPLIERWLRDLGPTSRLAFGAVLHFPVADREEGYRQVSAYLPFEVDADSASDFMYQINRPRLSSVIPELKVNRLSKWSCSLFHRQAVSISPQGVMLTGAVVASASACRLELDFSTVPDYDSNLPEDQLWPLLRELVTLGEEVATKGDVP